MVARKIFSFRLGYVGKNLGINLKSLHAFVAVSYF